MRASRTRPSGKTEHISGAETICAGPGVAQAVSDFAARALGHVRGKPDTVTLTIEHLDVSPGRIASLHLRTLRAVSASSARHQAAAMLAALGVSDNAIRKGLAVLESATPMRGAALMRASSGVRLDPDRTRGVRASRFGLTGAAGRRLALRLSAVGLCNQTVTEALLLASKVASCQGVLAELCVSDDPDYTTGYVASGTFGYVRIPCIKTKGLRSGGRVIFLGENADPGRIISYLEKTPVMITRIAPCSAETTIDELFGRTHQ